jgi:hypothetical protein
LFPEFELLESNANINYLCYFSLTMPTGTAPSKPFASTKPTVRLRSDFKLKLAKQKMEDEERRRRQMAAMTGSQPAVNQAALNVTLSSSVNESSRASAGQYATTVVMSII